MNEQEIFTTAYKGLASQNFEKSEVTDDTGMWCLYRGPNGLKCAIGHCISDEDYSPDFDTFGKSAKKLQSEHGLFPDVSGEFLNQLQDVHDNAVTSEEVKANLHTFASTHNLEVPEL